MSKQKESKRNPQAEDESKKGISRRKFLGTLAGGGAALAVSSIAGCAPKPVAEPVSSVAIENAATGMSRTYQVYEADVAVVGGGLAGMFAAEKAISDGASVVLIDKGPFGHSGTSGINWGHDMESNEWSEDDGTSTVPILVSINEGMIDQDYVLAMSQAIHEAQPILTNARMGCVAERNVEGVPNGQNAVAPLVVDNGCFPRMFAQHARRSGAKILERTMILDVLLSDAGEAAGVVGIDLVTGEALVVRAKSVVMATGSYAWCHGWYGNGPMSIAGLENTGDGHSMFLNHGAELTFMEQLPASCYQVYPDGIAYGMGSLGFGLGNYWAAVNKNGERVNALMDTVGVTTGLNNRLTFRQIYDGLGSPDGGVYLDTTGMEMMNRYHKKVPERELWGLQYTLPDLMEVRPQFWESAARPVVSTKSETTIPGLFFAGSADMSFSGCSFFGSCGTGYMSGRSAAERAASIERPRIVWSKVQDILNTAYGALERSADNPIRSLVVYHNIQKAMFNGVSFVRNEQGLKAAIAELERIKTEEFPRMVVPQKTRRFNNDWRQAMEVPNMWNSVYGTALAALARTETRGSHIRSDFPSIDNVNWLKNVFVSLKDGVWTTDARPVNATMIPADQIPAMIINIGFEKQS